MMMMTHIKMSYVHTMKTVREPPSDKHSGKFLTIVMRTRFKVPVVGCFLHILVCYHLFSCESVMSHVSF
jgi:hypothetical protein